MDDNNSTGNNVANEPEIQLEPQEGELYEEKVESEQPQVKEPSPEQSQTETIQTEQPRTEENPVEQPQAEELPVEQPQIEGATSELIGAEQPQVESTETEPIGAEQPQPSEARSELSQPTTPTENTEAQPSQNQATTETSDLTTNSQEQKKPKSKKPLIVILIIVIIVVIGTVVAVLLLTGDNNKTNASLDSVKRYCEKNGLEIDEGTRQTNPKMDYIECESKDTSNNYGMLSNNKSSNYIFISFGVAEKPILGYEDYVKTIKNYGSILEESGNYLKAYSASIYDDDMISYIIANDNTYIELIASDANKAKTALIEVGYPDDKWPNEQDLKKNNDNRTNQNELQKDIDDTFDDAEINDSYFVSDDKKYVLTLENEPIDDEEMDSIEPIKTHMVYYYSGDKITGLKTFGEFTNPDDARKAFDEIKESGEDMTYYSLKDKYIIVTATADQYEGMTASDVQAQIDFMESLKNIDTEELDIDDENYEDYGEVR